MFYYVKDPKKFWPILVIDRAFPLSKAKRWHISNIIKYAYLTFIKVEN